MTRTSEVKVSKDVDEMRRFEQLVTSRQFTGNSLLPEFTRLLECYKKLVSQSETVVRENRRLKTQFVEMSRSLELTTRVDLMSGLANRRDILRKIEQEYSRALRHHRTFSVILADIDGFKLINDFYGFNFGDEVLVEVSNVLKSCIRSEDVCARWGGEEFLLLLPETTSEGAEAVAAKICQTIAMTEFRVNKPGVRVTMSLGVGCYDEGQTTFDCIARAEQALSQAKQTGRNRYSIAA